MGQHTSSSASTDDGTNLQRTEAKSNINAQQDNSPEGMSPEESDRPLPPTEDPLDPNVLTTFQCPFQQDFDFPFCDSDNCPFGHLPQPDETTTLRTVPQYLCLDRLLDRCASQNVEHINEQLVRCENGFHISTDDMDIDLLIDQMASVLVNRKSLIRDTGTSSRMEPITCVVCLKTVPSSPDGLHAFLENCPHHFCAKCIIDWRKRQEPQFRRQFKTEFGCPTCRKLNCRIMLWPRRTTSNAQRLRLFALQKRCFGLMVEPQTEASVQELYAPNQFLVSYKGNIITGRIVPPRKNANT